MEIPVRTSVCIDFNTFIARLGAKHGWNYRDMANKYGKGGDTARPYQDAWHWLTEHAFPDVTNNCEGTLYIDIIEEYWSMEDEPIPDYVLTVLNAIFDAIPEDHEARSDEGINFYFSW